jgi:hypothetical protein
MRSQTVSFQFCSMFPADVGNRRILKAALSCAAEETVPTP